MSLTGLPAPIRLRAARPGSQTLPLAGSNSPRPNGAIPIGFWRQFQSALYVTLAPHTDARLRVIAAITDLERQLGFPLG
ncbi:MAG: hypothetical protein R2729_30245 [Bryobacteraceae bacterium]